MITPQFDKYDLFKISVTSTDNLSILSREGKHKADVIADCFTVDQSIPIEFEAGYGIRLAYVYKKRVGDYIIGQLGKRIQREIAGPPETGFKTKKQEEWPNVTIIVNVSHSQPLGQTVAVERNRIVYSSVDFHIGKLLDALTARKTELVGYDLTAHTISKEETFWEVVNAKKNQIKELKFDLTVPNFLNLSSSVSDGMKEIKNKYNAVEAELSIKNPAGTLVIPQGDKFIGEAVEYASKGAGEISIDVKGEGRVNTKKSKLVATITKDDTEVIVGSDNGDLVKTICDKIFLCLKDLG